MSIIKLVRDPVGLETIAMSHINRYKDPDVIKGILKIDKEWRLRRGKLDALNRYANTISRAIAEKCKMRGEKESVPIVISSEPQDLSKFVFKQLVALSKHIKKEKKDTEAQLKIVTAKREDLISKVGNILHPSCPVSNNEADNKLLKTHGETPEKEHNHVELIKKVNGYGSGSLVAGSRGYFLMRDIVRLNQALINYGLDFLVKQKYTPVQPPYFMTKDMMQQVAQLEQFDEELYRVGDDKYLIATSEQPLCALHYNQTLHKKNLPIRYAGVSSCFRKEAGSHGKDTLGIFRVHQFEKVEQFCITEKEKSWDMMKKMLELSEKFYQSLGISYRVVSIVSGKLNNAAALKYDIEGWFPGSRDYRELVSCSNCTDYQSYRMNIRYNTQGKKEYVHMLNATLCATERTMCCLLETYQAEEGIYIPKPLQPYMDGQGLIKFE